MKLLPFILMLALVGCDSRESRREQMTRLIRQWVPQWTSLQTTRQIMDQHQFTCRTLSFDSLAQMTNTPNEFFGDEDYLWTKFVDQKGQTQTLTNLTHLHCTTAKCEIVFIVANDQMIGFRFSGAGL